jgi:glycosyltransferase involved in cell wall biosynthesis
VRAVLTFGIDARAAAEVPAGRGRVVRELLRAFARGDADARFVLYAREPWDGAVLDERFRWRLIGLPDPIWHLACAASASRATDALLSTNSYLTAWFTTVPTVPVVHDLVAWLPGAQAQARAARIERATIRPAIRRATTLLCNSHATRRDLIARFPAAAPKAAVMPLAADRAFATPLSAALREAALAEHGLARPFVLSTGTLEPRKNLSRLLDAWALLPEPVRAAHDLVLVGPKGWEREEVLRRAGEEVRVLGFVSDAHLVALYQSCRAFAYPSLYEGFGLPVLEAMSAGAPAVTSDVSSLPEVGGDAVLYADPRDTRSIAAALERALTDEAERARLAEAGPRRAAGFSWERAAGEALAALQAAAASTRS